ncbi:hypothetical protein [Campylobacter concisus]
MAYPLLGTKIVIDEEKVLREKKYKLDVIYEYLDKLAKQCDLIKIDKNTFHAKGDEKDLANLALRSKKRMANKKYQRVDLG